MYDYYMRSRSANKWPFGHPSLQMKRLYFKNLKSCSLHYFTLVVIFSDLLKKIWIPRTMTEVEGQKNGKCKLLSQHSNAHASLQHSGIRGLRSLNICWIVTLSVPVGGFAHFEVLEPSFSLNKLAIYWEKTLFRATEKKPEFLTGRCHSSWVP